MIAEQPENTSFKLNALERRSALMLSFVYATRMLGLFMILPVLALYSQDLVGATALGMGLAMGIYGLTQACLQIPAGWLSDRVGRKPVIVIGLLFFAVGSYVSAEAHTMTQLLVGRALQGCGAVAGVVLALAADLTRDEQRSKVMAFIGASIGLSFVVALIMGPLLYGWIGGAGIFWVTGALSLVALVLVVWAVPSPVRITQAIQVPLSTVWRDAYLWYLNFSIFVLHLVLTACFFSIPLKLTSMGLSLAEHWKVYLGVMLFALLIMVPALMYFERRKRSATLMCLAIGALLIGTLIAELAGQHLWAVCFGLLVFFAGFNTLEAILPSTISRHVAPEIKGAALGMYSTSQFLGSFAGGVLAGAIYQQFKGGVLWLMIAMIAVWAVLAIWMTWKRAALISAPISVSH
ncbi:MAG: MFS transporter [Gammaproteobacteria bacterium]|nr:MFS transporter [Gammaproteobacteria bacterium]